MQAYGACKQEKRGSFRPPARRASRRQPVKWVWERPADSSADPLCGVGVRSEIPETHHDLACSLAFSAAVKDPVIIHEEHVVRLPIHLHGERVGHGLNLVHQPFGKLRAIFETYHEGWPP